MPLSQEAEAYIQDHKIRLTEQGRQRLANRDPKQQMQWLVNPLFMYMMEQTIQGIWSGGSNKSSHDSSPKSPTYPDDPYALNRPIPRTSSDEGNFVINLFG